MNQKFKVQSRLLIVFVGLCVTAIPRVLLSGDSIAGEKNAAKLTDIKLGESGRLVGVVLDGQGNPVDKAKVRIFHHDRRIAAATTNARGLYVVKGLRGGVHVVHAGPSQASFRFWTHKSAPPIARKTALNIVEGQTIRGQVGPLYAGNPGLMGLGAVAIAGLVVAIDKQESINDLKTALSRQEAVISTLTDDLVPVSP